MALPAKQSKALNFHTGSALTFKLQGARIPSPPHQAVKPACNLNRKLSNRAAPGPVTSKAGIVRGAFSRCCPTRAPSVRGLPAGGPSSAFLVGCRRCRHPMGSPTRRSPWEGERLPLSRHLFLSTREPFSGFLPQIFPRTVLARNDFP